MAASIPELRAKMRGVIEDGVRELVVDLTDVRMVDSSGIGLLISAYNSLRKVGRPAGRDPRVRRDSGAIPDACACTSISACPETERNGMNELNASTTN